jgi:hypothetical protein
MQENFRIQKRGFIVAHTFLQVQKSQANTQYHTSTNINEEIKAAEG